MPRLNHVPSPSLPWIDSKLTRTSSITIRFFMRQLLRFLPCGFVATLIGLYVTYWLNQTRCPDLTLNFLWDLIPVAAYVAMFPVSLALFAPFLKSHNESLYSFYGIVMWGAIAQGLFLLPLVFMTFPAERFFQLGATCNNYGENYFASAIGPFAVSQSFVWLVSLVVSAWFGMTSLKKT
jgi:hypothetical protein